MKRTAIVFALFYEIRPLAHKLGVPFLKGMKPQIILDEKNIALVRAGIGKERAKDATEKIINEFHPEVVISAGFCGALIEDLKIGDVIISDLNDGKIFCSDCTLFTYDEKAAVHREHKAIVVDMESESVASVARRYGITFIAIKAVSDGLRDDIAKPPFELPSFLKLFRLKGAVNVASERLSKFLLDYLQKGK